VNPPAPMTSEEASRPTGAEEGLRLLAASATDGVASPVGICEIEEIASPQDGQNRAVSGASVEQVGQRIKPGILSERNENPIGKELLRSRLAERGADNPCPRPDKQDYFFSAGIALEGVFVDLPSMATFHF
jgi:hypothetical protein